MKPSQILADALAAPTKLTPKEHRESIEILKKKGYSLREITEFLRERGVSTDHTAIFRLTTNPKKKGTPKMTTTSMPLAADYTKALQNVEMTHGQLKMIKAHNDAPNRSITYTELAKAANFDSHVAANSQYGKLGRLIGEAVGFDFVDSDMRPGEKFYSSAIGFPNPYTEGDFQLVMHHELAKGIGSLHPNWFRNQELGFIAEEFAEGISDERLPVVLQRLKEMDNPSEEFALDHDYIESLAAALDCRLQEMPKFTDNEELNYFVGTIEHKLTDR